MNKSTQTSWEEYSSKLELKNTSGIGIPNSLITIVYNPTMDSINSDNAEVEVLVNDTQTYSVKPSAATTKSINSNVKVVDELNATTAVCNIESPITSTVKKTNIKVRY